MSPKTEFMSSKLQSYASKILNRIFLATKTLKKHYNLNLQENSKNFCPPKLTSNTQRLTTTQKAPLAIRNKETID
jgi:hypothetical protein